jgi:hypothetical protein
LSTVSAENSTLSRLAPRSNYEAFLRLYEDEVLPLNSCLLDEGSAAAAEKGTTAEPNGYVTLEQINGGAP